MSDYRRRVLELYGANVVKPLLGDGEVAKKLLSELEIILDGVDSSHDSAENVVTTLQLENLPINYDAITSVQESLGYKNAATRLRHVLENEEIETYKDLVKAFHTAKKYNRSVGDPKRFFSRWKNMGEKTVDVLMRHLELMNVDFNKGRYGSLDSLDTIDYEEIRFMLRSRAASDTLKASLERKGVRTYADFESHYKSEKEKMGGGRFTPDSFRFQEYFGHAGAFSWKALLKHLDSVGVKFDEAIPSQII
jgi:hypothetical protein